MSGSRVVGLVCLLLASVGCAVPPSGRAIEGEDRTLSPPGQKRIVTAIRGDPHTIADAINSAGGGRVAGVREVEQLINGGLSVVDAQGQLRPLLSEAVPSLENGRWKVFPDGRMETTWTVRPDVTWHDGVSFGAADLAFTATIAMDKRLTIAQDATYGFIDEVEVTDPRSLTVRWKSTFVEADTLFTRTERSAIMPMARHVLQQAYTEDAINILQHPYFTHEFVGTGPFRIKDWTFGSHMVLQANDRFVLGRPRLDEIEVRFFWDTNVIMAGVLAASIDLTLGAGLSVEQAINAREQWHDGRVETPLVTVTGLWPQFINPDPAAVADVRFRRALLHALDRQQIVDTFLGSLVPVAHSFIAPDSPEYPAVEPTVVKYPHDPARAIQLIEQVGYTRGTDGAFRDATGRKLSVEVRTTAHDLREKLQLVLADHWQRIGVGLDPIIIPRQRAADREYRATTLGFDFRFNPPEVTRYHSSQVPLPENNYRGNNSARYRSPELDALLDRYVVTIPNRERVELLARIIHHMTDQLVVVPLFHDAEPVVIHRRLVNAGARKGDALQTWNAQDWDVTS